MLAEPGVRIGPCTERAADTGWSWSPALLILSALPRATCGTEAGIPPLKEG